MKLPSLQHKNFKQFYFTGYKQKIMELKSRILHFAKKKKPYFTNKSRKVSDLKGRKYAKMPDTRTGKDKI